MPVAVNPERVMRKVVRRLIPYLFICYIVNYIDRINVGYAALEMKADSDIHSGVFYRSRLTPPSSRPAPQLAVPANPKWNVAGASTRC